MKFMLCLLLAGCTVPQPLTFEQRMELTRVLQANKPYVVPPPPALSVPQQHAMVCTSQTNTSVVCQ